MTDPHAPHLMPAPEDPGAYWRQPTPPSPPQGQPIAPAPTPAPDPAPPAVTDEDVDFDAWWAEHTAVAQPHVTLFGERVPIPADIPMWVTTMVESGDMSMPKIRQVVDALFGQGAAERWEARGAGEQKLGTAVGWAMLRAKGEKVTFDQAITKAQEMQANASQQQQRTADLNARLSASAAGPDTHEARAERAALEAMRDAGKAPSSGTGAPSWPTSAASTGSPAPTWQF